MIKFNSPIQFLSFYIFLFSNLRASQEIPTLPKGRLLTINIRSTWGDRHYVGLNGIEVFTEYGKPAEVQQVCMLVWVACVLVWPWGVFVKVARLSLHGLPVSAFDREWCEIDETFPCHRS